MYKKDKDKYLKLYEQRYPVLSWVFCKLGLHSWLSVDATPHDVKTQVIFYKPTYNTKCSNCGKVNKDKYEK